MFSLQIKEGKKQEKKISISQDSGTQDRQKIVFWNSTQIKAITKMKHQLCYTRITREANAQTDNTAKQRYKKASKSTKRIHEDDYKQLIHKAS